MLDFVTIITNLKDITDISGPLWLLVNAFCYLMALIFGFSALMQLKDASENAGRVTYKAPIFTFITAAMLAAVPETIKSVGDGIFGVWVANSPLSSVKTDTTVDTFRAILQFISFMGYIFFVRGIFVLKQAGQPERYQSASVGKAVTILASGMCAIYIDITIQVVANTTGWDVSNYITSSI